MSGDNEQTEILRGMWSELKVINSSLNAKIDTTNARLDGLRTDLKAEIRELGEETRAGLADLRTEMHDGFACLDARIDRIGEIAGDPVRDRRDRVARLEQHAGLAPRT
ncbi:MAG: hypothetical protein EXR72_24600 [Myxococcales bacterium]|nr:hypothetical protein [Myxococcales bacterium]